MLVWELLRIRCQVLRVSRNMASLEENIETFKLILRIED